MAEAKRGLAEGMCVVIGLQSTGEAAADALGMNPGDVLPGVKSVNGVDTRCVKEGGRNGGMHVCGDCQV